MGGAEMEPNNVWVTPIPRVGTVRSSKVSNRRGACRRGCLLTGGRRNLNMDSALDRRAAAGGGRPGRIQRGGLVWGRMPWSRVHSNGIVMFSSTRNGATGAQSNSVGRHD